MLELAGLLVLGFLAQWLAWRIKVPAILPLILIGLMIGPLSTLFTTDGHKLIDGDAIFQGETLFDVISISVGIILFEGGLTLKLAEIRKLGKTLRNLVLAQTVVSLIGGALAAHYIMGLNWKIAFLFGSLIIVSGPTVIGPILRNVRPNANLNTLLKWEGILIDPIGALVAILIYEFISSGHPSEQFGPFVLRNFFDIIAVGVSFGFAGAYLIGYVLKRGLLPSYLRNVVVLGVVILAFAISDFVAKESGLLAVTLMGLLLANRKIADLKQIESFKADVTLILISFLFVLLSSRMNMSDIRLLLDTESLLLFCVVVFILRPMAVGISTFRSPELSWPERFFLAWISPRGIVAAAVASIFTVRLVDMGESGSAAHQNLGLAAAFDAKMLLPLTFLIIVGTVVLQGLTAKPLAQWLGVTRAAPNGVLFLGANEAARFLAQQFQKFGIPVLLADTSRPNIADARAESLPIYEGSILSEEAQEAIDLGQYGRLMAMTPNSDINHVACRLFAREMGRKSVFRLPSDDEMAMPREERPDEVLFLGVADYIQLTQFLRQHPTVQTEAIPDAAHLKQFLLENSGTIIPLFISHANDKAFPLANPAEPLNIPAEAKLHYLST